MSHTLLRPQSALLRSASSLKCASCACRVSSRRSRLHVAATAQPDQSEPTPPVQPQQPSLSQSFQLFVSRYEGNALASGVGALAVTSWCVAHGQDALTAAGITGSAVVLALVLNEVLFSEDSRS